VSEPAAVDLRCSMQARASEVRPIGTATAAPAFALLELPLPWPSHIEEHPSLAGVTDVLASVGARVQGIVPSAATTTSGSYRATLYWRRDGTFHAYQRAERTGVLGDLAHTCEALVAEVTTPGPTARGGRRGGASRRGGGGSARDWLMCTHGSRDRCCGSIGTAAFATIDHRPDVRLSRTSHLGGHRFAPTGLLLPEGTMWAWLDESSLAAVLDRSAPVPDVIGHYRGSVAMPRPEVQAAEAAVFADVGWAWLEAARAGEVIDAGDDRWVVRIDSSVGSWRAEVVNHGDVAQPTCSSDEPSSKHDPQLDVVALDRAPS